MRIIQPQDKLTRLGDLVNILQQYHNVADYIYTDNLYARDMIEFLLTLFDGKLKLQKQKPNSAEFVSTTWTCEWPNEFGTMYFCPKSYKKAINLPNKQDDHVVCQFDFRTPVYWNRGLSDDKINAICGLYKNVYNIGDRELSCANNCNNYSLSEKYELLKTANIYIGINSGLSHLALMTNATSYILYQEGNNPWFFYPDSANIIDADQFVSRRLF